MLEIGVELDDRASFEKVVPKQVLALTLWKEAQHGLSESQTLRIGARNFQHLPIKPSEYSSELKRNDW